MIVRKSGVCRSWQPGNSYGMIWAGLKNETFFVHASQVVGGGKLAVGTRVTFEVADARPGGKLPQAINVVPEVA
jgi:cold shock CspA family protein